MRELRNDLGQTFGTKKSKKAIASLTINAISKPKTAEDLANREPIKHDAATQAMLRTMAEATAGMATREELQATVDESKPRPKANLEAENVKDVYTIEDLIGSELMKVIPAKQWQDAVNAKNEKEIVTESEFVSNRVRLASQNVQKLKVLRYLLALLDFYRAAIPKRGLRILPKKDELRPAMRGLPEAVVGNIVRKFSDHGMMSKFQIDLLITNACALALIVDNFEVDMYHLRADLKLEAKEMQTYFSEIGARILPANEAERKKLGLDKAAAMQHKFARLRLPLEFPKAKFTRKERK
jgi:DNA-directed RNA polymerase I subunit RPA49